MAMKRWATAARVAREGGQSHQALHLIMVCFGIQGVEDCFDEQQVGATVQKTFCLFLVGFFQLIECNGTVARVIYIGRQ